MEEERAQREEERAHREAVRSLNELAKAGVDSSRSLQAVSQVVSQLERQLRDLRSAFQTMTDDMTEVSDTASSAKKEIRELASGFGRVARGFRISLSATTSELRNFRQNLKRSADYFLSLPAKSVEKLNLDLANLSTVIRDSFKEAVDAMKPELAKAVPVAPVAIAGRPQAVLVDEVRKVRRAVERTREVGDRMTEEIRRAIYESARTPEERQELENYFKRIDDRIIKWRREWEKDRRKKIRPEGSETFWGRLFRRLIFSPQIFASFGTHMLGSLWRGLKRELADVAFTALGPIGQVLRTLYEEVMWERWTWGQGRTLGGGRRRGGRGVPRRLTALKHPRGGMEFAFGPLTAGPTVPWARRERGLWGRRYEAIEEAEVFRPTLFATQVATSLEDLSIEEARLSISKGEIKQDREAKITAKTLRIEAKGVDIEGAEGAGRSLVDRILDVMGIRALMKRGKVPEIPRGGIPGKVGRLGRVGRFLGFLGKRALYLGAGIAGVEALLEGGEVGKALVRGGATLAGGLLGARLGPIGAVVGSILGSLASEYFIEPALPKIGEFAQGVYEGMKKIVKTQDWIGSLSNAFTSAWEAVKGFFGDLWDGIKRGIDKLGELASDAWKSLSGTLNKVLGVGETIVGAVKDAAKWTYDTARDAIGEGYKVAERVAESVSKTVSEATQSVQEQIGQAYRWWVKGEAPSEDVLKQIGVKLTPIVKQIREAQRQITEGPGAVFARFETGLGATIKDLRKAAGMVSRVAGIWGYGIPQFTPESAKEFLEATGFKEYFKDVVPGTEEFKKRWQEVAADPRIGKAFAEAQIGFVREKFLTPAAKYAKEHWGIDIERSQALTEAMLARAVQLGPGGVVKLLGEAFRGLKREEVEKLSEEEIIRKIYQAQRETLPRFFKTVLSRDPTLQKSLAKRFKEEEEAVLYLSKIDSYMRQAARAFEEIPHYEPPPAPPTRQVVEAKLPETFTDQLQADFSALRSSFEGMEIGTFIDQLQADFSALRSSFEGVGMETPPQPVIDYYPEDLVREEAMRRERTARAEAEKQRVVAETIATSMTEQLKPETISSERPSPFPMIASEEFNRVPLMVDDIAILMLQLGLN
jgi:prophage DNA circulation protein